MSVLCYMSLSFGCGRVCSCERAGCVLRTLYLYVVMFWFLCSQVVLAGGKYVLWRNFGCGCKGHMLFPGKRTDFGLLLCFCLVSKPIRSDYIYPFETKKYAPILTQTVK